MNGHLTTADAAIEFIFAGKACFTIKSLKSGKHYTYRCKWHDGAKKYFVHVLAGPNSQNFEDRIYIGYCPENKMELLASKNGKPDAPSFKALYWVLARLSQNKLHPNLVIQHEGKCCRCGRRLTRPDSIERGIGPECLSKL